MPDKIHRICCKISGEALKGEQKYGIDPQMVIYLAKQLKEVKELGIQVAIIIGGGNIIRGSIVSKNGIDRSNADYMGMMATVINAMALCEALEKEGMPARIQSAIMVSSVAEPFILRKAIRHLEKGRIVIFAGGTGNPFFTTDSAAVLRSIEIGADILFKATKVNGVYDKDPFLNPDAKKFDTITFKEVFDQDLKVMDMTAITLCIENNLPIRVFDVLGPGNFKAASMGMNIGTLIKG